jgi:hypothetical protein
MGRFRKTRSYKPILFVSCAMKVGDLVISARGHWQTPRLVVELHETAKALIGILFENEIKYVHYKHLEVINDNK